MSLSQLDLLSAVDDRVMVVESVRDWVEAVKLAGAMLVASDVVEERYVDAMVKVTQELGPYAVLAPGVAMPHARPEDGAKRIGLSILVIKNGVNFDSPNDPVYVVIGFAAIDKTSHLSVLKELAELLDTPDIVEKLRNASSREEVVRIIKEYLQFKSLTT
jgi:mannitol/fructose-specific phosphotransferase system IIA component (Ntr-type)